MDMSLSKLWELVMDKEAWRDAVRGGHKKLDMTEQQQQILSNTDLTVSFFDVFCFPLPTFP